MKVCPKCHKTYTDDTLNFCLNDGAILDQASSTPETDESLPATVMMDAPRPTDQNPTGNKSPNQSFGGQAQYSSGTQPKSGWGSEPTHQINQTKPKSRAWLWVLGIIFGVIVLCGGGTILLAVLANFDETPDKPNINIKITPTPFNTPGSTFSEVDMSQCESQATADSKIEYKNGECIVSTLKKGFYFVIVNSNYETDDKTTRLTVRNIDEKSTRMGFGIVFHSKPQPLQQGYAFLIDSEGKKYRLIRHVNLKEKVVINWKKSNAIKDGAQKNVLEIRTDNNKIDLYINGQFMESVKDSFGYGGGVPGIYSSDGIPIAFSDLELDNS